MVDSVLAPHSAIAALPRDTARRVTRSLLAAGVAAGPLYVLIVLF